MNHDFTRSTAARIGALIVFLTLMGFLGNRIYSLSRERASEAANLQDLNQKLEQAKLDETKLQDELKYLSNPANMEKEVRARYNYKAPGEKMIVIVPNQTSTSSTNP